MEFIATLIASLTASTFSLIGVVISSQNKRNSDLINYQFNDIKNDIKELQIKVDKTDDLEKRIIILEEKLKRGVNLWTH